MGSYIIRKFPELLNDFLGPNRVVENTEISRLTPPGENFGSIMLKLDITLLDTETGAKNILSAVAKILPDTELFRELFNVQVTYTNEMAFYDKIVPMVRSFQRKLGISEVFNCFPECIATRKNLLENSDKITDDAVVVLENLKEQGFDNIERTKGFDFQTTKMILRDLALFHAVFIAFRNKQPADFEKNMKPYLYNFMPRKEGNERFPRLIELVIEDNKDIAHLASKIKHWGSVPRSTQREPFATVIHTDLWINNTMQKFENGRPVANKIVDFQACTYGSPAADLFFFLWTSVSTNVLKENLDYFIRYYYDNLMDVLTKHQYDITQCSFEKFLKEIELECEFEIGHALFFLVLTINGSINELETDECPEEEVFANIRQHTKEKAWYLISECAKRGWLK